MKTKQRWMRLGTIVAAAALSTALAACDPSPPGADAGTADTGVRPTPDAGVRDGGRAPDGAVDGGGPADGGDRPDTGPFEPTTVPVPSLPPPIPSDAPRDADGRPILVDTGTSRVLLDEAHVAGPLDTVADCLALVLACRTSGHGVDDCVFSLPRCTTARPWEEPDCCPATCWTAYETLRLSGTAPVDSLHQAVIDSPSCVPGLDALVAGGAP